MGLSGAFVTGLILLGLIEKSRTLAIVLSALTGATTLGLVIATFKHFQKGYLKHKARKKSQREKLERKLDSLLCPTCAEEEQLAASYEGWSGSVHTFWFASAAFARLFRASNPRKCLEDGEIHGEDAY